MFSKPEKKPESPYFSSGPCAKRPGWNNALLEGAILGRSHRSKIALNKINQVIDLTKELLKIPNNYYETPSRVMDASSQSLAYALMHPPLHDIAECGAQRSP